MRLLLALLGTLMATSSLPAQERLTIDEYADRLSDLRSALGDGRWEEAHAQADALRPARIVLGGDLVATDGSLLAEVAKVREAPQAALVGRRIAVLEKGLRASKLPGHHPASDHALLERLRAEQTPPPLAKGGQVAELAVKPLSFPERVLEALRSAGEWLGRAFRKLLRWLVKLWPPSRPARPEDSSFNLNLGVLAMVALITATFGVLAYRALLRRKGRSGAERSQPLVISSRDENPLSREANEWERYAMELAAAGRRREAIRALYHAVLMALVRCGTLHYHKSRTNWEYAALVPPEAPFRPAFLELTRIFDREWYGRDQSPAEVLARSAEEARVVLKAVQGREALA